MGILKKKMSNLHTNNQDNQTTKPKATIHSTDKKTNDKINRQNKINKSINTDNIRNLRYLEQENEGYLIPENDHEKTLRVSQDYLKQNLPKYNTDNIFELGLESGPYSIDYSKNGTHLLLAGEKGHIAMMDWREKTLECEIQVNEKVRAACFLQNDQMFAVAQRKSMYIYDRQGIELHNLDYHNYPKYLEYLPYHFLLVSGLKNNFIKYQDISIGNIVTEIKTKSGEITCMTQNPHNATIATGHSTGVVNIYTPNFNDPVASILTHPNTVNNLAIDITGNYMVTSGVDSKMRVWDIRTYKQLYEYFNPLITSSLTLSQRGLLGVSYGNVAEVWKDIGRSKQKEPYMKHHFKNNQTKTKNMKFINFEDYLGVGTNFGYTSMVVPGSGEANFDTFESNPFQTKKQRQTQEVKMLLEKIPSTMISLDPNNVNKVDARSKVVIKKEREEELRERTEKIIKNQKKKNKMRLSNKEKHDQILKDNKRSDNIKKKIRGIMEIRNDRKIKET